MIALVYALAAVAAAYQLLALIACLRHAARRPILGGAPSPVSILKPVRGLHPGFYEALRSHAIQTHPQFELLLGCRDPRDPAIAVIERVKAEFPRVDIRLRIGGRNTPNGKAGVLLDLLEDARYPRIVLNDADILVPQGYLEAVTAPLDDPGVGVVTCLYRAEGDTWPDRLEALGVATDFAPSALVAPLFGISEFGFGSTLAFRRTDLDAIGGFAAVADYLADDYQLGARIHKLGRRNLISTVVVQTRLNARSWRGVWSHQLRWARTIRVSRPGGYAGLPVTFATFWALLASLCGAESAAVGLLAIRLAAAVAGGWLVLRSRDVWRLLPLIPVRDLLAVAVWAVGLCGDSVEWGGLRLRLDRRGRIVG